MDRTAPRPLILTRGFGGPDISGEQRSAYQGYNDGTVYPGRRGENYIYEGFLLRAMKSDRYRYNDATNVIGYYAEAVDAPEEFDGFAAGDVSGTVVIDPRPRSVCCRTVPPGIRIRLVALNPQPLPPRATIDFVALNPQPLPPGGTLEFVAVAARPAD
jgi:hypothetical protein